MIPFLLRLIAFLAGLWIVRRLLGFLFSSYRISPGGSPKQAGASENTSAGRMVKDPVCGMYMDARLALQMDERGETVYFCSEDCRQRYQARGA